MAVEKNNNGPTLKPGDRIDGYHVLQVIGKGNMGDVYLVRQLNLDRMVALKTMKPRIAGDKEFLERFYREAQAAGRITHPNIVRVYDVGCENDIHYIAMEFVDGETVWERMKRERAIPVVESAAIGIEVLKALGHAHRQGIVHRDIKPDNILVDRHGDIKVSDFGLAMSIEGTGVEGARAKTVIGTLAYLPPELWRGGKVDGRADIYSLGASLYHMLTGQKPFPGNSNEEIFDKMKRWDLKAPYIVNADVPKPVSDVIMKMMAPDPPERFADCQEAMQSLSEALAKCVFSKTSRLVSLPPGSPPAGVEPELKRRIPIEEGAVLVDDHAEKASATPREAPPKNAQGEENEKEWGYQSEVSITAPSLRQRLGLTDKRQGRSSAPPTLAPTPATTPLAQQDARTEINPAQIKQGNLDPVYSNLSDNSSSPGAEEPGKWARLPDKDAQQPQPQSLHDIPQTEKPTAQGASAQGASAEGPPSTRELIVCGILLSLAVAIFLIAVIVYAGRIKRAKVRKYEELPGMKKRSSMLLEPAFAEASQEERPS
ncbi:MAG TPA: protein kinase [Candidatus Brocadiia bacterium]|nr:protein kinase [Candidatus Brocadiia bacterium]